MHIFAFRKKKVNICLMSCTIRWKEQKQDRCVAHSENYGGNNFVRCQSRDADLQCVEGVRKGEDG